MIDAKTFIKIWNESSTVDEVLEKIAATQGDTIHRSDAVAEAEYKNERKSAYQRAWNYRRRGIYMKLMSGAGKDWQALVEYSQEFKREWSGKPEQDGE